MHIFLLLFMTIPVTVVIADVIFTSERCNRVTYGLRTVNGDPGRYKQCGPSGRVWIVPCAPQMSFDPQDRVCKEDRFENRIVMRKYETHPKTIITTPAPLTTIKRATTTAIIPSATPAAAEEFVFSTIRPKRPRTKTKKRRTSTTSTTTTTTTPIPITTETTTQPNIVIFSRPPMKLKVVGGPAFSRPTPRPVTHATKFVPKHEPLRTTQNSETHAKPATLAPYQKVERNQNILPEEPLSVTVQPEYTVKYNGQSMTENEFLTHLLSMVKTQKMLAEKERLEKFEKMEQERLREEKEEKERELERRRQLEEMERARQAEIQRQAAMYAEQERMAAEREQEIARIRQEDRRRELERRRKQKEEAERKRREEEKKAEMERQQRNERVRQELEAARKRKMEEEKEMERRRLVEEERVERERALIEEMKRRELEEQRRREKQIEEMREFEEQRRKAAEEQSRIEQMEKEREIIRQLVENQRHMEIEETTPGAILQPIYRPEITEYQPPELEMIRFTTTSTTTETPWMMTQGPTVYQGCLVNGDCELKYDYDSFCQHPTDPSSYLQCAPLYGRSGRWTERQCPETLQFMVALGRCEKPESPEDNIRRPPYDPDNRVVIPRLPSETEFVQWTGNRVIDSNPQNRPIPRVYPPIPESEQPQIYNTIEEFPRELLPVIPENIHGSVVSGHQTGASPQQQQQQQQSYPIMSNIISKSSIDLSNIHPLFPRVQPDFLSRIIPALNLKLQDEANPNNKNSIGSVVKPVLKQIAMNQTELFLDRLLADQIAQLDDSKQLRSSG